MINLTAQGSGYYIVTVGGVDTTQHVTEREAIESAVNQEQANPTYSADTVTNTSEADQSQAYKMGHTDISEHIRPNRWQEITLQSMEEVAEAVEVMIENTGTMH